MTSYWLSQVVARGWQQQVFTTSGTWTHPKPGTCVNGIVICIGGGGQGGAGRAGNTNAAAVTDQQGGGGQPGAVVISEFVTTSDAIVVVGAGGSGRGVGINRPADGSFFQENGNANNDGAAGGASSFGRHCVAIGGEGGLYGSSAAQPSGYIGAQIVLAAIGALSVKGGPGRNQTPTAGDSIMGYAGGGAGNTVSAAGSTSRGGSGGAAGFGGAGGNGGNGAVSTTDTATTGGAGSATPANSGAGGGGGGGATKSAATNNTGATTGGAGGNGGSGKVIVYWEIPA